MNLSAYLVERAQIETLATPFALLLLLFSLLVAIVNIVPSLRRYASYAVATLAGLLIVGFVVLASYHLKIYQTVSLADPATGAAAGRFAVPLWIEGEKLYFECVLFGLLAILVGRRPSPLAFTVGALFAILTAATALWSNPFLAPLPDFHGQLVATARGLAQPDLGARMQVFARAAGQMHFYYNSTYMWIHPPLLFASYAAFGVSFVACLFMLRSREPANDLAAYGFAKFGYLLLTLGILLGYPWAITAWRDSAWWWAPKVNMALMLWFAYTAYLHARLYLQRRGLWTTTALLGVACFAALVLTYVTTYLVPGTHSVA